MSSPTRREFLTRTIVGATALAVFGGEELLGKPAEKRAYKAGKFALEIDGAMAGWIESVDGGQATSNGGKGNVLKQGAGRSAAQGQHFGTVKYEDITLTCGAGMSRGFYDWITTGLSRQHSRKNGAIISSDYDGKEISRLDFNNATIAEIVFPRLDASSKDQARLTIKITPESTRMTTRGGKQLGSVKGQKVRWLSSAFRLEIDGVDCTRVDTIEAIPFDQRGRQNLVITVAESHAQGFDKWQKGRGAKKAGRLDYLTPDLREALFTLRFPDLRIVRLSPEKVEAHGENVRRMKVEMSFEDFQFSHSALI